MIDSGPESEKAPSVKDVDLSENALLTETAPGVQWNVQADTCGFKIADNKRSAIKRRILSATSSVYDPLGSISPCLLAAKAILQDLCHK